MAENMVYIFLSFYKMWSNLYKKNAFIHLLPCCFWLNMFRSYQIKHDQLEISWNLHSPFRFDSHLVSFCRDFACYPHTFVGLIWILKFHLTVNYPNPIMLPDRIILSSCKRLQYYQEIIRFTRFSLVFVDFNSSDWASHNGKYKITMSETSSLKTEKMHPFRQKKKCSIFCIIIN